MNICWVNWSISNWNSARFLCPKQRKNKTRQFVTGWSDFGAHIVNRLHLLLVSSDDEGGRFAVFVSLSLFLCSHTSGWRRRFWARMAESSRRSLRNWPTLLRGSAVPCHNLPSVGQKNFTHIHFNCHNVAHIITARVTPLFCHCLRNTDKSTRLNFCFYAHNSQGFKGLVH